MITTINKEDFPSNVTKEYYEVIRELISVLLMLDGYRTIEEGAHKKQIDYLNNKYDEFTTDEILLIDDLRVLRNKIAYDGFFVKEDYIGRKQLVIENIIKKLKFIIQKKFNYV